MAKVELCDKAVAALRQIPDADWRSAPPADRVVTFAVNRLGYSMVLSEAAAAEFDEQMAPWIELATKHGSVGEPVRSGPLTGVSAPVPAATPAAPGRGKVSAAVIRAWLAENRKDMNVRTTDRGRLSDKHLQAYYDAHPGEGRD